MWLEQYRLLFDRTTIKVKVIKNNLKCNLIYILFFIHSEVDRELQTWKHERVNITINYLIKPVGNIYKRFGLTQALGYARSGIRCLRGVTTPCRLITPTVSSISRPDNPNNLQLNTLRIGMKHIRKYFSQSEVVLIDKLDVYITTE
jgi:hypothetical protein